MKLYIKPYLFISGGYLHIYISIPKDIELNEDKVEMAFGILYVSQFYNKKGRKMAHFITPLDIRDFSSFMDVVIHSNNIYRIVSDYVIYLKFHL